VSVGVLAAPFAATAQRLAKTPRIGVIGPLAPPPAPSPDVDGFRQGLRELGYAEGQNISVEYRWLAGRTDRVPEFVAELTQLPVEVIVLANDSWVLAAKPTTTPIVMAAALDPVRTGVAASLARPGGNVTGLSMLTAEVSAKRVELIREAVPGLTTLAVFVGPQSALRGRERLMLETEAAARQLGLRVVPISVKSAADIEAAYRTAKQERAGAILTLQDPFFSTNGMQMAELAVKNGLATMAGEPNAVEVGCLMRYGANIPELWRRAAVYVDKILKGAKPADLPIEQPTKFELVINLKTAKTLGLTIPPSLLQRADQVIDP